MRAAVASNPRASSRRGPRIARRTGRRSQFPPYFGPGWRGRYRELRQVPATGQAIRDTRPAPALRGEFT